MTSNRHITACTSGKYIWKEALKNNRLYSCGKKPTDLIFEVIRFFVISWELSELTSERGTSFKNAFQVFLLLEVLKEIIKNILETSNKIDNNDF